MIIKISKKVFAIVLVCIIALVAIGYAGITGMFVKNNSQQPVQVSVEDDSVKGPENAKVTIVVFTDYQCPFCGKFAREILPLIISEYVDSGKAKIAIRDFPLSFHTNSEKAAEASECAHEQGKFWEYHDKLFANQQKLGITDLKQYAKDLGLDTAKFDQCLDSGKYANEVKKDFQDGQSYGVSGTPTILINGMPVIGAQPFSAFKQIIDAELAK